MVKGWRKQFETEEQRLEFDLFFEEFNVFLKSQPEEIREKQPPINIFLMSQLILMRNEIKKLKKELIENDK